MAECTRGKEGQGEFENHLEKIDSLPQNQLHPSICDNETSIGGGVDERWGRKQNAIT